MIKFHQKYFIESFPCEKVNPIERLSTSLRNIHNIENKLTRFQIFHETEFAKHNTPKYLLNTTKVSA